MASENQPLTNNPSSHDTDDDEDYITAFSCMYCQEIFLNPYKLVAHKRANHSVQHAADNKRREAELKETGLKLFVSSSEEEDDSEEDEMEQVSDEPQVEQLPPKDPWALPSGSVIPSGSFAYSPVSLASPLHDQDGNQESEAPSQTVQSAVPDEEEVDSADDATSEFPDIVVDDVLRSLNRKLARWDSCSSFGASSNAENETGGGGGGGGEVEEIGYKQGSSGGCFRGEKPQVDQANTSLGSNSPLVTKTPGTTTTTATGTPMSARASAAKKKLVLKLKKRKTPSMRSIGWRIIPGTASPQTSFTASPQNHKSPSNTQQPPETDQLPADPPSSKQVTAPSTLTSDVQYRCRICPDSKKYQDPASRNRHEVSVHCCILAEDDTKGQNQSTREKTAAMYKCDDCGVPYRFKLMLKKHKRDCIEGKGRA